LLKKISNQYIWNENKRRLLTAQDYIDGLIFFSIFSIIILFFIDVRECSNII